MPQPPAAASNMSALRPSTRAPPAGVSATPASSPYPSTSTAHGPSQPKEAMRPFNAPAGSPLPQGSAELLPMPAVLPLSPSPQLSGVRPSQEEATAGGTTATSVSSQQLPPSPAGRPPSAQLQHAGMMLLPAASVPALPPAATTTPSMPLQPQSLPMRQPAPSPPGAWPALPPSCPLLYSQKSGCVPDQMDHMHDEDSDSYTVPRDSSESQDSDDLHPFWGDSPPAKKKLFKTPSKRTPSKLVYSGRSSSDDSQTARGSVITPRRLAATPETTVIPTHTTLPLPAGPTALPSPEMAAHALKDHPEL